MDTLLLPCSTLCYLQGPTGLEPMPQFILYREITVGTQGAFL